MRWIGLWAVVAMIALFGIGLCWAALVPESTPPERADLITIDTLATFGTLERPPVNFLHEKHTRAIEGLGKDCGTCHETEKERLSPKFKRLKDTDKDTIADIYHDECIGCHREVKGQVERTGPITCGECHVRTPEIASSRQTMGMDKSLHFRHVKATDKKCETCHHEFDEKEKKLFYAKGKEGSCRYCHRQETEENRVSFRLASHLSCLTCHRKNLAEKKTSGPVRCLGCHDADAQNAIARLDEVPRMERNQPDTVFVRFSTEPEKSDDGGNPPQATRMNVVAFNHKGHEQYNDTCRVCHHENINACASCHTPLGAKEGDFVRLQEAMHRIDAGQSCVGCHNREKSEKECAGCHGAMPQAAALNRSTCNTCHLELPDLLAGQATKPNNNLMASVVLKSRSLTSGTFNEADIPEKVMIDSLVDLYDGVELPHRRIVKVLMNNIKENQLAGYFHQDKGTLCQGCHHNSPPSKKPPACGSCHGLKEVEVSQPTKPALVGAYHQQCIGCHQRMTLAKPDTRDCTNCHIEKRKW